MTFYWLNSDNVPTNLTYLALQDTSGTPTNLPNTTAWGPINTANLGLWPFYYASGFSKIWKGGGWDSNYNLKKYKNFSWKGVNSAWWFAKDLLLLQNTLWPRPYPNVNAPAPLRNNVVTSKVNQLRSIYFFERTGTLASLGYTYKFPDFRLIAGTSNRSYNVSSHLGFYNANVYKTQTSFIDHLDSTRALGTVPGQAGDQYDFKGTVGVEAITYGEPQVLAVYRQQLIDLLRPIHYFDLLGNPFDASSSPFRNNTVFYNGNYIWGLRQNGSPFLGFPSNYFDPYFFNKTTEIYGSGWSGGSPNNWYGNSRPLNTSSLLHSRTTFYEPTIDVNGTNVAVTSLLQNKYLLNPEGNAFTDMSLAPTEHYLCIGQQSPYNEQHMSWNMIASYVALTGDYMAEDEFEFLATPELAQYRPWIDLTNQSNEGESVGHAKSRFPGGGDREFGRKLLGYTQAMRVTRGKVFKYYYELSRQLCDYVDLYFRNQTDNYRSELPPYNNFCYTTDGGNPGGNAKNRIYRFEASSILTNFRGAGETNIYLPWQQAYTIRGLHAFCKYAKSQKYRDLLVRFCRSLMLYGLHKEEQMMPAGRRGIYDISSAPAAGTLFPNAWKTVNYAVTIGSNHSRWNGFPYQGLPTSSLYEGTIMYYRKRSNGAIEKENINPWVNNDDINNPAERGWFIGSNELAELGTPLKRGGIYGGDSNRSVLAYTLSAGFSAHPTLGNFIVSGVIPTGTLPAGAFSTEFNREVEYSEYVSWVLPAAQIASQSIRPEDELRFPRAMEARQKAIDYINNLFLGEPEFPSNYRTMVGHDSGNPATAPVVPPLQNRMTYETLSEYAVYGPIP